MSVVWDNPAWKPKTEVLCGFQYKIWELVGRLYHPRAKQPLIIKPDVLSNVYQMLYHCLFLVIIVLISASLLNLAFILKSKPYGLLLASLQRAYSRTPCVALGLAEYFSYPFLLLSEEEPEQDFTEDGAED